MADLALRDAARTRLRPVLSSAGGVEEYLQQALASRSTIDQALGVLMAQNHCTRDEAFGILRRASQNRNVKLRDVAAAVIHRFTGHPAEPPPPFRRPAAGP
jgi:AmiR/NasT family two-component response regulator